MLFARLCHHGTLYVMLRRRTCKSGLSSYMASKNVDEPHGREHSTSLDPEAGNQVEPNTVDKFAKVALDVTYTAMDRT